MADMTLARPYCSWRTPEASAYGHMRRRKYTSKVSRALESQVSRILGAGISQFGRLRRITSLA